jgi:hypothetical protein
MLTVGKQMTLINTGNEGQEVSRSISVSSIGHKYKDPSYHLYLYPTASITAPTRSLHGNCLGQIAGTVHIGAFYQCGMIGQELYRNDVYHG